MHYFWCMHTLNYFILKCERNFIVLTNRRGATTFFDLSLWLSPLIITSYHGKGFLYFAFEHQTGASLIRPIDPTSEIDLIICATNTTVNLRFLPWYSARGSWIEQIRRGNKSLQVGHLYRKPSLILAHLSVATLGLGSCKWLIKKKGLVNEWMLNNKPYFGCIGTLSMSGDNRTLEKVEILSAKSFCKCD